MAWACPARRRHRLAWWPLSPKGGGWKASARAANAVWEEKACWAVADVDSQNGMDYMIDQAVRADEPFARLGVQQKSMR